MFVEESNLFIIIYFTKINSWHQSKLFSVFSPPFREKLRELNNELLKKNACIDEMELKCNSSCKFEFMPKF